MDALGLDPLQEMEKPSVLRLLGETKKQTSDKQKAIRSRLEMLGY
jgi:hypothetical protein